MLDKKKDDMFKEVKKNLERVGETVTGLVKNSYRTGKLRLDIVNLKHRVGENFKKIGMRVYKHHKTEDDEIVKLCKEIDKLEFMIKNKEAEIEKVV